MYFILESNFFI